jgi:hypothetical protein
MAAVSGEHGEKAREGERTTERERKRMRERSVIGAPLSRPESGGEHHGVKAVHRAVPASTRSCLCVWRKTT